ncbi:PREDICTED: uncharacterized protein C15orf39 homolog [Pygoscelis adeliae]|nr:PREDICTED: uncharacterized protein C15orf39 homolog [Pygoscelis adeliae]
MASKRHLESLDPVIFNKLPRLETEPAAGFPNGLCKSSPVPNPGSENHFNYKGSYFACPLQSPDGPEQPLVRWSPSAAYLHYGTGAGSQPTPAEGSLVSCLLYRPESLGTGLQPPGTEKGKDSLMRELLMTSAGQYFATLHTSLCDIISCSVSRSSPELLREWLKKAEPAEELGEMPKSPPKPKNGSKIPEPQKPTKGKEIWLAFQDVAALLTNLLSQLETFMFARKCPFPHVVRAGAVFIPIHVVKEKLFPKLAGASVDQVLQEHKVELRPTTLSEERHLRDLELKSCTSRMLKLLALKQLPDIYPDLLAPQLQMLLYRNSSWRDLVNFD